MRGIGDDCAVLRAGKGFDLLVTTDLCVEDVHFRRDWHPPRSVGHRCLARGLSDIAAMGGEPVACFLSLALPANLRQSWVNGFLNGLLGLARQYRVALAGGDISSSEKITADIVVLGKVPAGRALLRSGAQPRDKIYVTGSLGGSAAALNALYGRRKAGKSTTKTHFYPAPRLNIGRWLREHRIATAAIDLSDGLSVDLGHICDESRVSALVEMNAIPVAPGADLEFALHGGEDYELLFTARPSTKLPAKIAGVAITQIGEIERAVSVRARVRARDDAGKIRPLAARGWQHFAKK